MRQPVQQLWTLNLPWKMQTVMLQGLRAPDTHFCKNTKTVSRWLRSIILNNADNNHTFMCRKEKLPDWTDLENELNYCSLHFTTHFLYALEIVHYKHPEETVRKQAGFFYWGIVREMCHFEVEREKELDVRLADVEEVPDIKDFALDILKECEIPKQCPSGRADNYDWKP